MLYLGVRILQFTCLGKAVLSISIACFVVFPAQSETLASAVLAAMKNNNARKATVEAIKAQGQMVAIMQGERGVRVDLFGEVAGEVVDDSASLSPSDNNDFKIARQVGVNVEYTLLDGMRSLNALFKEATLLDAEIIRLADETETLALGVVQAFLDVTRHQAIVRVAKNNITIHEQIAVQVNQQVEAGKLSGSDRFRAEGKVFGAKLALTDAEGSLAEAIAHYEFLTGAAPKGPLKIVGGVRVPRTRASLVETALINSLQMKLVQKNIDALQYQELIDDADWQPRINLFAGGYLGENLDGSSGSDSSVGVGLRMNWTLYKGGTRQSTSARNRDLIMRAHYQKKQVADDVRDFATRAWIAYASTNERIAWLEQSVATRVRIAAAYRSEFKAAKRSLLQVLEAERDLFNANVLQINANASQIYQKYKMLAAQNALAGHFGLAHSGRPLAANFEQRVKSAPREGFDISAPALK